MRVGKYPDRDEKLATFAPAVPAKAGTHGSAAASFSGNCSALPTLTSSCGGTVDPGFLPGKTSGPVAEAILARPHRETHPSDAGSEGGSVSRPPPSPSRPRPAPRRCPGAPTIDSPTGSPSTAAPGMLTCGTPVSPPWQHRQVMRSRSGLERRQRLAAPRRRERRRRQAEDRPGRQQLAHPAARLLRAPARPTAARSRGSRAGEGQVAGHAELQARVVALDPVLEGLPRLVGLQGALRPRPRPTARAAPSTSSRPSPISAASCVDHRLQRRGGLGIGEARRRRPRRPAGVGKLRRDRLAEHHRRDAGEGVGVAREPAGRVRARRLRHHAGEVEPAVRRPDAVEPAEARRHPHRAAGVGAERGVAQPCGDGRRPSPTTSRRARGPARAG